MPRNSPKLLRAGVPALLLAIAGSGWAQLVPSAGNSVETPVPSSTPAGPVAAPSPEFTLDAVVKAITQNGLSIVYLLLALVLCYGAGWLVLRAAVRAKGAPGDSGCLGCLFSVGLGLIFLISVFFGIVVAPVLPPAIFWGLLAVTALLLLLVVAMKGGSSRLPLFLIVLLVVAASGIGRYFFDPTPSAPVSSEVVNSAADSANADSTMPDVNSASAATP